MNTVGKIQSLLNSQDVLQHYWQGKGYIPSQVGALPDQLSHVMPPKKEREFERALLHLLPTDLRQRSALLLRKLSAMATSLLCKHYEPKIPNHQRKCSLLSLPLLWSKRATRTNKLTEKHGRSPKTWDIVAKGVPLVPHCPNRTCPNSTHQFNASQSYHKRTQWISYQPPAKLLWCTKRWHCFSTAFTYISTYTCNFSDWVWKKFNLVLYGIKECPKGTPRHSRLVSDLKSVADILSSIDTQVSQLSIRDNYRLGKYQPNRSRPILVKMTRSSEVSSISLTYVVQKWQEKGSCHLLISCHQVEPDELGAVDWPSVVPSLWHWHVSVSLHRLHFPLILIPLQSTPSSISDLRSFSGSDSMSLSLGERSAFIKMPGWDVSLCLLVTIDDTSEDGVILTKMGLERFGWYFPSQ